MPGDRHSALPVRTQDDLDERMQSKIIDYLVPTQGMQVDLDKNAHVEVHGNNPAAGDEVLRLSELGAITPDGVYDVANNTKPGNLGLIGHVRNAAPSDAHQTERITSITNGSVKALDISLHDEAGAAYSPSNPMPVTFAESEGVEFHDPHGGTDVAKDASETHEYTATADLLVTGYHGSASGKMKMVCAVETGVLTGIYVNRYVHFNSTANPDIDKILTEPIKLLNGQKIRLIKTNRDNDVMPLYSTIAGHTV
jgi:hypothetical protein